MSDSSLRVSGAGPVVAPTRVSAAALQALVNEAQRLPAGVVAAAMRLLDEGGARAEIEVARVDALGAAGAELKALLVRANLGADPEVVTAHEVRDYFERNAGGATDDSAKPPGLKGLASPPSRDARRGILPGSIFNPRGVGNVTGADPLWSTLSLADVHDRSPRLDADFRVADPNTVMATHGAGVHPEIQHILTTGVDAPRTGEAIAKKLAELYGPFTAQNSAANRRAIIENLLWIADTDTGIRYQNDRAAAGDTDTYPPNHTLSTRLGVCRDIHTAVAAVLASLIQARLEGGTWVPGSPTGQESSVQVVTFNNPSEFHAYLVYRDPLGGGWNALEYGKDYALNAPNAIDAFAALPGYISGYTRYTLRGWDERPVVNDRGAVGAERANQFFELDPGVGTRGETRLVGSANDVRLSYFVHPRVALVASLDPSVLANGLRGGLKINYHQDLVEVGDRAGGYLRLAGGVYSDFFDASLHTGERGAQGRVRYHVYVLAVQFDGRRDFLPVEIVGEHLRLQLGADWRARLGLPLASGPNAALPWGAVGDYSRAEVGGDAMLRGHERLATGLDLDWGVGLRADLDFINAGTELVTAGGQTAERSLLRDPLRTQFGLALTHRSSAGLVTRIEAGGSQYWLAPYDAETAPRESHFAALTISPASGAVNFGVLARGETLGGAFLPAHAVGAALDLRLHEKVTVGVGAEAVLPGGDVSRLGGRVQVRLGGGF